MNNCKKFKIYVQKFKIFKIFVLKNEEKYVNMLLQNIPNTFTPRRVRLVVFTQSDRIKQKGRKKMLCNGLKPINIKDAANYVIGLFYKNNRVCKSAVVQKILFIAQLKSLKDLGTPLFEDKVLVKPMCFSIDFISKMYPTVIFEGFGREEEKTELVSDLFTAKIDNDNITSQDLSNTSFFYEIVDEVPEQFAKILKEVFCRFGGYSGSVIGSLMRELSLHKNHQCGDIISFSELKDYVSKLNFENSDNNLITQFIKTDI